MKPDQIDRSGLMPHTYRMHNGRILYYFYDSRIDIVKMDFVFEAGTALQDKLLQSACAIQMVSDGTTRHSAMEIADFMDFRGILMEKSNDAVSATLTVYSLCRYIDELLPLLYEMLTESTYPEHEFNVFMEKRRHSLQIQLQKTSYVARTSFLEGLFGKNHPLGKFASPADLDALDFEDVRRFYKSYISSSRMTIVLGGNVTEKVLQQFDATFGSMPNESHEAFRLPQPAVAQTGLLKVELKGAVQNSLRIGCRLPYRWDDIQYPQFMVLSTLLGGYFGSRLMTSIREDKGYTYGINAQTQVFRDNIVFSIITDLGADKAEAARKDILYEIERLRSELVSEEELQLVRNCMLGDFLRSIDGVFERSERFCQQFISGVDESFTDNFMDVLTENSHVAPTPDIIRSIASDILDEAKLFQVSVGQID